MSTSPCQFKPCLVWTCACWHRLCGFICSSILLYLEDTVSLESSTTSGSYNFLPPLQHSPQIPERRSLIKMPHLGLGVPGSLILCILSSCGSLCRFLSIAREVFSDDTWVRHWFIGVAVSLGIILMQCFLSRTIAFGFPLGPWPAESQVLKYQIVWGMGSILWGQL